MMARSSRSVSSSSSSSSSSCTSTSFTSTSSASSMSNREGAKTPEKSAVEYTVPEWFLAHNIKTPSELKTVESAINLCEEEPPHTCNKKDDAKERKRLQDLGWDDEWAGFYVFRDLFEELRDTTASALVRSGPRGRMASSTQGVVLRSSVKGGREFLDEMVLHVAKDLEVTLVSISFEDIEDIGWEFDNQEQESNLEDDASSEEREQPDCDSFMGPALHYFAVDGKKNASDGAWDRHKRAFSAILDAPQLKPADVEPETTAPSIHTVQTSFGPAATESKPFLLYFRDVKRMLDIDKSCKLLDRLQECVEQRRRAGESVAMVLGMSHAGMPDEDSAGALSCQWMPCHCSCWICEDCNDHGCKSRTCEPEAVKDRLLADRTPIISLTPTKITESFLEKHKEKGSEGVPAADVNLRRLQRSLRLQIPQYFTPGVLQPQSNWPKEFPRESLGDSLWSKFEVDRAAAQVVGRAWKRSQLDVDDVSAVLRRMGLLTGDAPLHQEAIPRTLNNNAERQKSTAWKKKMREIRAQCNSHEADLLSCIVNPDDLQSTYDDVILDNEIKETIRHLVFQSQFSPAAASHPLLSQMKMKGALLYGPPGTGKTHLGRAIAKDSGANMLVVDCASMMSQWVGETEKHIRAAFNLATKLSPCILFIDEVDSLFYHRRFNDKTWERSAITQFLTEMDGLGQRKDAPFVMVATNRPMDLDDAFLRRLPQKISFGLPNHASRSKILRLFLKNEDLDPLVKIEALATVTEGYSGSDLRSLCAEAALLWAIEQAKVNPECSQEKDEHVDATSTKLCLTKLHFVKALGKIRPTVSRGTLGELNKFTRRFTANTRIAEGSSII